MTPAIEFELAPCLQSGPLADAGNEFLSAMQALGRSRGASIVRAWCVVHLFEEQERIFASQAEPVGPFVRTLRETAKVAEAMVRARFAMAGEAELAEAGDIDTVTGNHYSGLFGAFTPASYWDEPVQLLRLRLKRNGIILKDIAGRSVLDAGCGGGRYTGAWRQLGARPALGIDISPDNVADAGSRVRQAGMNGISFQVGNVLSLPTDERFDIVFSNGVLHHTLDWRTGIAELMRVLKPGGLGWLYVIEDPGGLFWDSIEILRSLMAGESRATARRALQLLGLPANRIFYMLDHVMAPINLRLRPAAVEEALAASGATAIRRLSRGADFDRIERIYQNEPFAFEKFGAGENRYVFSK